MHLRGLAVWIDVAIIVRSPRVLLQHGRVHVLFRYMSIKHGGFDLQGGVRWIVRDGAVFGGDEALINDANRLLAVVVDVDHAVLGIRHTAFKKAIPFVFIWSWNHLCGLEHLVGHVSHDAFAVVAVGFLRLRSNVQRGKQSMLLPQH